MSQAELGRDARRISFTTSDLENLKGTYDTVLCIDVMIHYPTEKVSEPPFLSCADGARYQILQEQGERWRLLLRCLPRVGGVHRTQYYQHFRFVVGADTMLCSQPKASRRDCYCIGAVAHVL